MEILKTKRRQILIALLIISTITIALVIWFNRRGTKRAVVVDPVRTHTQIPEYIKGELPIQLAESTVKNLRIPNELPIYSYNPKVITEEGALSIAQKLGFIGEPLRAPDVLEGTKLVWSDENASLWVTPAKSFISYYLNSHVETSSSILLPESQLLTTAQNFLYEKFGLDSIQITPTNINYLIEAENPETGLVNTTKEKANIYQFNFTYKDVGLPIMTNIPSRQIIFVYLLPEGTIIKSEAYIIENLQASPQKYAVKNSSDLVNSLNQARLLETENDYISLNDLQTEQIQNIDVQNFTLAYLLNTLLTESSLKPVFELSGNIRITGSSANFARLLLPAFK